MNRNKKIANMAMLVVLAMIFSYVESLITINFGVPGMKLGIANLVTVTGIYLNFFDYRLARTNLIINFIHKKRRNI